MRRFILLLFICRIMDLSAQNTLSHPGAICCEQIICPGQEIQLIEESLAITPSANVAVEYAWFELIDDTTTASGTRWRKIPNTNSLTFLPTTINSVFGGFFMRAVREVGTLPYLFSNIVTVKLFAADVAPCTTSSQEPSQSDLFSCNPNPATDLIRFNFQSTVRQITLLNSAGRVVETRNALVGQSEQYVEVSDFPVGLYVARVLFEDGKIGVHKFVVAR
jgi:Secretion system C-terminal sorting domain